LALLKTENLTKVYTLKRNMFSQKMREIKAVDGINLELESGKTLGLVGESGCGKSTLSKLILKLIAPTTGRIIFDGEDITSKSNREFRPLREDIQIVFQDPYGSLSPRLTIKKIISEPLEAFDYDTHTIGKRVSELLVSVGMDDQYLSRYPHQLSGGQRQRVSIARALATSPRLLVLDEAVSSLDLSTQAQIINLLVELQEKYKLTYLFIAHDLGVIRYISDKVAVMHNGKIVEMAPTQNIYNNPLHPYTKSLLASMPKLKRIK